MKKKLNMVQEKLKGWMTKLKQKTGKKGRFDDKSGDAEPAKPKAPGGPSATEDAMIPPPPPVFIGLDFTPPPQGPQSQERTPGEGRR